MRKLYFLLPGTTGKFACGGLSAELKTLDLAAQICPSEVVTYRQRQKDTLFLTDLLQKSRQAAGQADLTQAIFVVSWGFDAAKLVAKLRAHNLVYHAHSAGYRVKIPAEVPIITVSRNTLGYWGQQAPHSLVYYLPNQISDQFYNQQRPREARDIDVLVQARKSSSYLLRQLIPVLQQHCRVTVVDAYVEDLAALFNRARVYLYDSAEYWALQGVSEGFGLQPLEAMACGCQVFSSLNGGLSDYLDPGFNCQKISTYSQAYDLERILQAVNADSDQHCLNSSCLNSSLSALELKTLLAEYRGVNILPRLQVILNEVNQFFDHKAGHIADIPALTRPRLAQLKAQQLWQKVKKRYLN
jgi:hypothetical protein